MERILINPKHDPVNELSYRPPVGGGFVFAGGTAALDGAKKTLRRCDPAVLHSEPGNNPDLRIGAWRKVIFLQQNLSYRMPTDWGTGAWAWLVKQGRNAHGGGHG